MGVFESRRATSQPLGVVGAVVLVLLRFLDFDNIPLLGVVAIAPLLLAIGILATGALAGLRPFLAAAVVVGVFGALWLPGTVLPRSGCDVSGDRRDDAVVLMSHNLLVGNPNLDSVFAQIQEVDPDVLFLQETTGQMFNELYADLADHYPYVSALGLQHIVSRWPLTDRFESGTRTGGALIATIAAPSGDLRVANVHPSAPLTAERRVNQREEYAQLAEWRVDESVDLLMGDFNASGSHVLYRGVVSDGYVDAHRKVGCGTGLTWSRQLGSGPALLSLDHALVHESFRAERFEVLDYAGSDHKAIAVRVGIP